jgi:hypothetical protein
VICREALEKAGENTVATVWQLAAVIVAANPELVSQLSEQLVQHGIDFVLRDELRLQDERGHRA